MSSSVHISLNVFTRNSSSVADQQSVGIRQHANHNRTRVSPLVDHLLEDARVRMLGDEARPQHLEAFPRDLFDDRRVVEKPPAAEGHQVTEFSRVHAQLMLVLAA